MLRFIGLPSGMIGFFDTYVITCFGRAGGPFLTVLHIFFSGLKNPCAAARSFEVGVSPLVVLNNSEAISLVKPLDSTERERVSRSTKYCYPRHPVNHQKTLVVGGSKKKQGFWQ